MQEVSIFWFRRDLRLVDNAALYRALTQQKNVLPIFIFDRKILDKLEDKTDARVTFIHQTISNLKVQLQHLGSDLLVFYGDPITVYKELLKKYTITAVYANKDYEGYANHRDTVIADLLQEENIVFHTFKDQVIFETNEVVKVMW